MSDGEVKGSFYRTEIIAQLFGVTVRRVQQLTQEGIISTTKILEDGKSVRRYDLVPTIQAYVKYLSDKAYGSSTVPIRRSNSGNRRCRPTSP